MPEPPDETGFRDAPGGPEAPPLAPDFAQDRWGEDLAGRIARRPTLPGIMLAAGILWIISGVLFIGLFGLTRLLQVPFQSSELWLLVGALFFIVDGVRLILGTFRDPLGDGILSLLVGLFLIGQGWYRFSQTGIVLFFIVGVFFSGVFAAPGILVLIGRKRYLAWKAGGK